MHMMLTEHICLGLIDILVELTQMNDTRQVCLSSASSNQSCWLAVLAIFFFFVAGDSALEPLGPLRGLRTHTHMVMSTPDMLL